MAECCFSCLEGLARLLLILWVFLGLGINRDLIIQANGSDLRNEIKQGADSLFCWKGEVFLACSLPLHSKNPSFSNCLPGIIFQFRPQRATFLSKVVISFLFPLKFMTQQEIETPFGSTSSFIFPFLISPLLRRAAYYLSKTVPSKIEKVQRPVDKVGRTKRCLWYQAKTVIIFYNWKIHSPLPCVIFLEPILTKQKTTNKKNNQTS